MLDGQVQVPVKLDHSDDIRLEGKLLSGSLHRSLSAAVLTVPVLETAVAKYYADLFYPRGEERNRDFLRVVVSHVLLFYHEQLGCQRGVKVVLVPDGRYEGTKDEKNTHKTSYIGK